MYKSVIEIPKLKQNKIYSCASCLSAKVWRKHIGPNKRVGSKVQSRDEMFETGQHFHADLGFVRGSVIDTTYSQICDNMLFQVLILWANKVKILQNEKWFFLISTWLRSLKNTHVLVFDTFQFWLLMYMSHCSIPSNHDPIFIHAKLIMWPSQFQWLPTSILYWIPCVCVLMILFLLITTIHHTYTCSFSILLSQITNIQTLKHTLNQKWLVKKGWRQ